MENVIKEIEAYVLNVHNNDMSGGAGIDISITDEDDEVATIWGDSVKNIDWECKHPYQCVEFGDDVEEQGECLLCGSYCDWHKSPDENTPGYPEPHEWYPRRDAGGLIGKLLKKIEDRG